MVRWGLLATYAYAPSLRSQLRLAWGRELLAFVQSPTWKWTVAPILGAVCHVLEGMERGEAKTRDDSLSTTVGILLSEVFAPLHRPDDFAEWRDQLSLVGTYNAELSRCMIASIRVHPGLGIHAMRAILEAWPRTGNASTSKEIALLEEIEEILLSRCGEVNFALDDAALDNVFPLLLARMAGCVSSENWRLCERALHMWRYPEVVTRFGGSRSRQTCDALLPALIRDGSPHWNPTVNRMTVLVVECLEEMDPESFLAAAEAIRTPEGAEKVFTGRTSTSSTSKTSHSIAQQMTAGSSRQTNLAHADSSHDVCLGRARQRSYQPSAQGSAQITAGIESRMGRSDTRLRRREFGPPPPASVTGSAPWRSTLCVHGSDRLHGFQGDRLTSSNDCTEASSGSLWRRRHSERGINYVRAFTNACKMLAQESASKVDDAVRSDLAAALAAETPSRLPELKFHDLVFGHDLGRGAFGVVRYAKRIVRVTTDGPAISGRTAWPEFAVKIFTKAKLQDHAYDASVAREICALHELNHPGVARLVSAFKWQSDAFVVLEYAAGGDLHADIAERGALDVTSTRFVIGSLIAGLESVHDQSLVFADLKPENVVLTAAGHVKLTDFGACRGVTSAKQESLNEAAASVLNVLRHGDPQARLTRVQRAPLAPQPFTVAGASFASQVMPTDPVIHTDCLANTPVEGTLLYSAPEVACLGMRPGFPADIWALGCLAHYCIESTPRIQALNDSQVRAALAQFQPCTATFAPTTPQALIDLERTLLHPDPLLRPTIADLMMNAFFDGLDVRSIYRRPAPRLTRLRQPEDQSYSEKSAARTNFKLRPPDVRWTQRQYSRLWAPLDHSVGGDDPASKQPSPESAPRWLHDDPHIVEAYTETDSPFISQGWYTHRVPTWGPAGSLASPTIPHPAAPSVVMFSPPTDFVCDAVADLAPPALTVIREAEH